MKRNNLLSIIFIFLINSLINSIPSTNGIVDFRDLNIKKEGVWLIKLDTKWEFYFNKLLFPSDFAFNSIIDKDYISVPGFWNINNFSLPKYGYATYRIVIKNVPKGRLSIIIPRIFSSYRLFINGELNLENGVVGENRDKSIPFFKKRVLFFDSNKNDLEIILHVSNYFEYRGGGLLTSIKLGTIEKVKNDFILNYIIYSAIIGALIFIIIYHLFIFFFTNRKDKGFIFIPLFSFFYLIRTLLTNSEILYSLVDLPAKIFYKIEILVLFLSIPVFLFFFKRLFYYEAKKIVIDIYMFLSALFSFLVLILPSPYFSFLLVFFYFFLISVGIVVIVWTINTLFNKRKDSILFFISFVFLVITVINDILFSFSFLNSGFLTPLGILIFVSFQVFILNSRFYHSFDIIEELSEKLYKSKDELLNLNAILEEKVRERTIELEKKIEENERMKEQIFRMQKIEALSLVTGGVAHDFNNILSIILSNVSLLKINKEEGDTYIYNIENAVNNAKSFIKQLLTLSKGEELNREYVDILSVLKEILKFCFINTQIKYTLFSEKNKFCCYVDKGQIYQLFLNIIVNAKQAMKNNGKLEVNLEILKDNRKYNINEDINFVKIDIIDNGCGIPKENLSKIFEPFWTTKKDGNGIGLATCVAIVQKHSGYIFVDSKENVGTKFTILLP